MPKDNRGKISVIMGIYNCSATLPNAIESILNQTYRNWELILCDDGSTDGTYQVAEKYAKQYPDHIILIRNEQNRKLAFSLNRCLEYASGEYIARMDGDDISRSMRLETQIDFLDKHPEYDLVGCAMQWFDEKGLANIIYSADEPNYYTMRRANPFFHATILARREVYDKLNGYTVAERTSRAEDSDFWFRFYHEGFRGYNLRDAMYLVREDARAVRRRTFRSRWSSFQTTRYGYKLLKYPKWWIVEAAAVTALKSVVPYKIVDIYRKWQRKKAGAEKKM